MSNDNEGATQTYKRCDVCGETFDLNDLDQVFHHDGEAHAPLDDADAA